MRACTRREGMGIVKGAIIPLFKLLIVLDFSVAPKYFVNAPDPM